MELGTSGPAWNGLDDETPHTRGRLKKSGLSAS